MKATLTSYLLPRGARYLVLCADVLESVDGVRAFANHARTKGAGESLAYWLLAQGATVTVIAPKCHRLASRLPGARLIEMGTDGARSLLATLEALREPFDLAFQLARVPSLRPTQRALNKIKAKKEYDPFGLSVEPNVEVFEALASRLPCFGYDLAQRLRYAGPGDLHSDSWFERLSALERATPVLAEKYFILRDVPDLSGRHIIVTSGPTAEAVSACGDVLTNFSSGRQGYQIAWVLACAGAKVSLVSGPGTVVPPAHPLIETRFAQTAAEMLCAVHECFPADGFVSVAAVADFKAKDLIAQPLTAPADLVLNPTNDILLSVAQAPLRPKVVIGFAAETENLISYAQEKRLRKGVDIIFANNVGPARADLPSGLNQVTELSSAYCKEHPLESKRRVGLRVAEALCRALTR